MLSHDQRHIVRARIKKNDILRLFTTLRFLCVCLENIAYSLLSLLPLLLVVLRRMFSHYVYLEIRGLSALVVAVITGKRLLTSVRSHVYF